jgi:sec-independent protein translocase protein TatA
LIILAVVILVFGVGRIEKTARELGGGIRAFRQGLKGDDGESNENSTEPDDPG